jgi:hypothetical protein
MAVYEKSTYVHRLGREGWIIRMKSLSYRGLHPTEFSCSRRESVRYLLLGQQRILNKDTHPLKGLCRKMNIILKQQMYFL